MAGAVPRRVNGGRSGGDPLNSIMTEYYPACRLYQALREQLVGILGDEDLT